MSIESLEWVAKCGRLPWVRTLADGSVILHPASGAPTRYATLSEALSAATRVSDDDDALVSLIAALDTRPRASGTVGGRMVLASRDRDDIVAVVLPNEEPTETAAAVSHELSNVLGAILGWAQLGRRRADGGADVDRALALIETSARNAHATARHFLDAARGRVVGRHELIEVDEIASEVVEALEPLARERRVEVTRALHAGTTVRANREELFSVVWNLVQNALDAAPPDTRVIVRLEPRGESVVLEVEDRGPGVPAELRARIFEPYFTTKGSGTGLGLPLVRKIVEALDGTIELDSAAETGARFVVTLRGGTPSASIAPPDPRPDARAAPPRRVSGVLERGSTKGSRILVVDDDDTMRDLLATALGLAGADVETAADAASALALRGKFDLALVDLGLADMRGDELVAELQRRGAAAKTAILTGHSLPPSGHAEPDAWLRKPFELDDLLAAVRALLGDRASDEGANAG